jgi:hypothetical protein
MPEPLISPIYCEGKRSSKTMGKKSKRRGGEVEEDDSGKISPEHQVIHIITT